MAEPAPIAPSIWEPLDGSTPQIPTAAPQYGAPGSIGWSPRTGAAAGPTPAPHQVAAAYAATAQAAESYVLATWTRRAAAYMVDVLLFGVPLVAIALAITHSAGLTTDESTTFFTSGKLPAGAANAGLLYAVLAILPLLLGVAPAILLTRWDGRTPGKRMLGLRVMRADGQPITLALALRREVVGRVILVQIATVFTFGIAFPLNYLWPLYDGQRRAGHDLFVNTRVVIDRPGRS